MDGSGQRPPVAPGGDPVIGHTRSFMRSPLATLEQWGRLDDSVVRVKIVGREVCLVTAPAGVEEVLTTDAEAYRKAEIVRDRLGTLQGGSLVLLEGEQWRDRRDALQPAVTETQITAAGKLTTAHATAMVSDWPTGESFRADEQVRELSLSILADVLFDLDMRDGPSPIHNAAEDIMARMAMGSVSTYLPEWVPTPTNRRYRRAVETLHDELDTLIAQRTGAEQSKGRTDLLSVLVQIGADPETIRNELIAFLFAGYDSTATALAATLGLLGQHPAIQSDLCAELAAVPADRPPRPDDLPDLPLLDAVIRESLRLYPPQYLLFREPARDIDLQGYRIDAGTTVVLSPWILHRNPGLWDEPAQFRPERWIGDTEDRPEFAYFPYGGGPRRCLGVGFAAQTLRLVTAVICRRRTLELTGPLEPAAGPTLSFENGIHLRARKRATHDDQ